MVCTTGLSTPAWRGVRITCTPSDSLKLLSWSANTNSSPPRARTSCMLDLTFSSRLSLGAITTTGMSSSTSASGPCLSSPAG
ncbi:hypothetical protein D3C71_1493650 [compost metagenome]